MAISTNGTVLARLAGALYNTQMSNATYSEVKTLDPSALANTLYARDFASATDLSVATTLVTNLGLTSVTGLANWVAAQLTAAGAGNKGAKIVDLLNGFAQLTTDTVYGAAAIAFNASVDAALVLTQTTGNAGGTFAAAGAPVNATFTLTTGADTFTGAAGNDTFNATGATLTAGDVLNGGANDKLVITDVSASFASGLPANVTVAGIPTASISTTGKLGTPAALATGQSQTFRFTESADGSVTAKTAVYSAIPSGSTTAVTVTATKSSNTVDSTGVASAAAAVTALTSLYNALGYVVGLSTSTPTATNAVNISSTTSTVSSDAVATITVKAAPGVVIPTVSVGSANANSVVPLIGNTASAAATAAAAASVSGWTGLTSFTGTSAGGANISAAATTNVNLTSAGTGAVIVSGGLDDTIIGSGSVYVSGAKGAVSVTSTAVPTDGGFYKAVDGGALTGLQAAWGTSAAYKSGVLVTGGTTVSVAGKGATASSTTGLYQDSATPGAAIGTVNYSYVQIGSQAITSAIGSPTGAESIKNIALNPTGDVTVNVSTAFTDNIGLKDVAYGQGEAHIYTNGSKTVSVTGAWNVYVTDIQTTPLLTSTNGTYKAGNSSLSTVNVIGAGYNADIASDALANLKVVDSNNGVGNNNVIQATTVSISSTDATKNADTLNLSVGNSVAKFQGSNNTSLNYTTLNVTGVQSAYQAVNGTAIAANSGSTIDFNANAAKTLSISGSSDVTLGTNSSLNALTVVNATTSGKLTLGDITNFPKLVTVDAGGATGKVIATISSEQTFKGGAGNDKITIAAVPNYSVDGGTGVNEIVVSNAAALVGLSTSTSNFQVLGLGADALTTSAQGFSIFAAEVNTQVGNTINHVTGNSATVINTGYTASMALNFVNDNVALKVQLGEGSSSVVGVGTTQGTLTLGTSTESTAINHTVNGVSSLTVNSSGVTSSQVLNGHIVASNLLDYADASALTTVVVTGDSAVMLNIGGHTAAQVTTLDASTSSGDVIVNNTFGYGSGIFASSGATIKGGAGSLTVTGSAGADSISIGAGGGTIYGSTGGDTIQIATIQTAATNLNYASSDSLSTLAAFDKVTGFVNYAGGNLSDTIDVPGTATNLTDTSGTAASQIGSSSIYYTAKNGIVKFFTSTGAPTPVTNAAALITALETLVDTQQVYGATVAAFELAGNTYVVAGSQLGGAANDTVVELVGVSGLTALSASTAGLHTLLVS